MSAPMQRLAIVGECMLEFHQHEDDLFKLGFAGDAYNVAVYFARQSQGQSEVDFISAVGTDNYSNRMIEAWRAHDICTRHVRRIKNRMPGLYIVETDDHGERDFHYYRSEAAARFMFTDEEGTTLLNRLASYDYVYFSGITLAILKDDCRDKFLAKLPELKKKGVIICFDTNFRPKLWPSREAAMTYYNLVLSFVDIVLPSFTDMNLLFGDATAEQSCQRLLDAGVKKVILTDGDKGYVIATEYGIKSYPVEPVSAIDTTGAGDSFNGAYLAAIMKGDDDEQASVKAAALASKVVLHRGAIIKA